MFGNNTNLEKAKKKAAQLQQAWQRACVRSAEAFRNERKAYAETERAIGDVLTAGAEEHYIEAARVEQSLGL